MGKNDLIYNVLDRCYFKSLKVFDYYVFVFFRGDILNWLEIFFKDVFLIFFNDGFRCDYMERYKVLDKCFFEEFEVVDYYV